MERPSARKAGLLVEPVDDEVVVYDTERYRAHALNGSAAAVWRQCDGETTPTEMAASLSAALQMPVTEGFVRYGLGQLRKFHLLEEPAGVPPEPGPSRRDLLRAAAFGALALPLITSIVAPVAAEAQSSTPDLSREN